jgi:hypothetical protein
VAGVEAVALIVAMAWHGGRAAPLVITLLVVKLPFCAAMAGRRPGAYLTIWLYEGAALFASLAKPHLAGSTRLLAATAAALCIALLVAAAPTFPEARLPKP